MLTKRLYWEGAPGRRAAGYGDPGELVCLVAHGLGFYMMGLFPVLSLANHSDSGSFLVGFALLNQDGFQQEAFWDVGRTYGPVSSFERKKAKVKPLSRV